MEKHALMERIKETGCGAYEAVRMLDDGTIVGIGSLMFTRAIYVDMNLNGWGRRYCFKDAQLADLEYKRLSDGNQEPEGWIATR
jgi:hypothetical protein